MTELPPLRASPLIDPVEQAPDQITRVDGKLNPWVKIWRRPRAVIRQAIDRDRWLAPHVFAGLSGLAPLIAMWGSNLAWGPQGAGQVLLVFSAVFVLGNLGLYALSGAAWLAGRLFDGRGGFRELRTAIGWSLLPAFCLLPIGVLVFLYCVGNRAAIEQNLDGPAASFARHSESVIGLLMRLLFVAYAVLAISEAHRVGTFRGIVITLISYFWLVAVLVAGAFVYVLAMLALDGFRIGPFH